MRINPASICFILFGALLSLALWTPVPLYCFLGFVLVVTCCTLAAEEYKRRT